MGTFYLYIHAIPWQKPVSCHTPPLTLPQASSAAARFDASSQPPVYFFCFRFQFSGFQFGKFLLDSSCFGLVHKHKLSINSVSALKLFQRPFVNFNSSSIATTKNERIECRQRKNISMHYFSCYITDFMHGK